MKKLISILLALVLVCSMGVTVFAAEFNMTIDSEVIEAGEDVTVTVKLNETIPASKGATMIQGKLSYNTDELTFKSMTASEAYNYLTCVNYLEKERTQFYWFSTTTTATEFPAGTVVTAVYTAKEDTTVDHLTSQFSLKMDVQTATGAAIVEDTTTASVVISKEHTWNGGEVTTPATCSKDGVKTYTCTYSGCGETKTEKISATGDHVWDKGTVTTEPTCIKAGVKTYKCTTKGCTETNEESIPATGEHTWDEGKVTTEATCTKEGEKLYTCTVEGCGKTKTEKIPAAHTWDEGKVTTEATCAKEGVKTYTCTVDGCNETKTEAVNKLAHTVDEKTWKQDDKNHWHECTVCGEKVDSEAHTGGKATTTKKAICEECGAEYGKLASVTNTNSGNTSNKNNNGNSSNTTTIGTNSPKTGDNSMLGLYGVLLIVSAGALVSYSVYRKRRNA